MVSCFSKLFSYLFWLNSFVRSSLFPYFFFDIKFPKCTQLLSRFLKNYSIWSVITEHLVSFLMYVKNSHMYLKHFIYMLIFCIRVSFWREGWEAFAEPWDDIDFISWFNSWLGWSVLTLPLDAFQVCYCFMFYYRLFILFLYTLKLFYY